MAKYLVKGEKLTAIADAVRNKAGTTASLSLDAMAITIDSMVIKTTTTINVVPDTTSSFTYDGSVKTPVWRNYDPEQLTITGNTSATNAGTYKVYFTPKADYEWSDGTIDPREVQWSIGRKAVSVPSQSGTLTYTGSSLSPSWSNYNNSQITIGGTTSGTNAGSYTATFTPNSNHKWSDGTTTAKSVTWSIAKAAGSLSLSATSATVTGKNSTKTFTVTRSGDGKISVSSSNTSIATVALNGTTVTITAKGYGTATITVSVAEGTNHKAPSNKTYALTVDYIYLYNAGDQKTSLTGGWDMQHAGNGTSSFASGYMNFNYKMASYCETVVRTKNKLSFPQAGCTKLKILADITSQVNATGYPSTFGLTSKTGVYIGLSNFSYGATWTTIGTNKTFTLDISSANGSYYVALSSIGVSKIYKVWLE